MKAALSVMFEDVRGKAGNVVVARSQVGPSVRSLSIPANPRTAVQQAIRRNLSRAAAAYRDLEPAVAQVWRDYAAAHPRRDSITGATYVLGPNSFFIGFAGKLLQIQADLPTPFLPPPGPFGGDPLDLIAAWTDQTSPPAPGGSGTPGKTENPAQQAQQAPQVQKSPPAPRTASRGSRGFDRAHALGTTTEGGAGGGCPTTGESMGETENPAQQVQNSPPAPGGAGGGFGTPGKTENPAQQAPQVQNSPPAPQATSRGSRGLDRAPALGTTTEGGAGGGCPTTCEPPGDADSPAQIRFTANQPNAPGVLTEILLQPLATRNRKPQPREYRTQAFVAFTPDRIEFDLPIDPKDQHPAFAPAYRFVNAGTGQSSPLLPLPVLYR